MRLKAPAVVLLILTVINVLVFIFRDRFQHKPLAGYKDLYGYCGDSCREVWRQFVLEYPGTEFTEAKKIADSVTRDNVSDYQKIVWLGGFLHNNFKDRLGRPSIEVLTASPLNQLKKLSSSDTAQLWCGNYAMMFAYLCWTQNIPSRIVEVIRRGNRHVINESYLKEINRWVMTDLTNDYVLVRDSQGSFMDFISLRDSLRNGASVTVKRANGSDSPEKLDAGRFTDHYSGRFPVYFYHAAGNKEVYSTGRKIKRYVLGDNEWYDIYDDNSRGNLPFRVKQVLLLLWAVSFFVFLFNKAKFRA